MTLYGTALFLHIVFAIALVGGTAWLHVALVLARRAESVEGGRSIASYMSEVSRAMPKVAVGTLVAGLYLAFDGGWWGAGWPVVSLALFVGAGAIAGAVMDPATKSIQAAFDEAPEGPLSPAVRASMWQPKLTIGMWVLAGIDLAIVALMTNKPGYVGSIVVGGIGIAVGAAMGIRENRHATAPATPAAGATPA